MGSVRVREGPPVLHKNGNRESDRNRILQWAAYHQRNRDVCVSAAALALPRVDNRAPASVCSSLCGESFHDLWQGAPVWLLPSIPAFSVTLTTYTAGDIVVSPETGMPQYIGAIDQGTTSTRFIVFDRSGRIVSAAQREHEQIYPQAGWVEHDPAEIWRRTREVIGIALAERALAAA